MSGTDGERGKPVTLTKGAAKGSDAPKAPRPRTADAAVAAMAASGLAAIIAAVSLYGQHSWLYDQQVKADKKAKPPVHHTPAQIDHMVSQSQSGALISTAIVVAAIAFLAFGVYRGRHWSRWGVVGFWFLCSFTGTIAGIGTVLSIGSSSPAGFKVPAFFAGLFMLVAVAFVNMTPSTQYFALSRPERPAGAPQRRGLFAPRPPATPRAGSSGARSSAVGSRAKSVLNSSATTRGEAYIQKQRAKKRASANAESVARGAELARNRAKASKSRRIES